MKTNTQELLEQLIESVRADETFNSTILLEEAVSGNSIPASHLTKIRKWTQKDIPSESIHTYPVLMIDTAPTRNLVIYTAESQKKTAKKWPGTTFLFNFHGTQGLFDGGPDHKLQAASQMARIYDAKLVKTPKGEIGTLAWFYSVEGIDEHVDSFIKKLDAGILREVSIHISAPDGVICSICNDAFSKCQENAGTDHYPGDKYGKQTCYMSTGEGALVPLELSAVACPGSVNAHVMSDDEVEEYPLVSLREALGGSDEAIQQIRQEKTMRTKEQVAEARKKLIEAAKTAGVSLREFFENPDNKQLCEDADVTVTVLPELEETIRTEANKCSECGHGMHEGACGVAECECKEGKEKSDPKQDPPEAKKQSIILDTEECVVCGRGPTGEHNETADVAAVRVQFKETVKALAEKSQAAIDAANAKVVDADKRAEERDEMFADLCEEVINLAIKSGKKKSSEKEAYQETLAVLPYQAVREIRESLRPSETKTQESQVQRLEQTSADRAKQLLGVTVVKTTEEGRKQTSTNRRPTFGAK